VNPVGDPVRAWRGVALIGAGKTEARAEFTPTASGLLLAFGWFVLALILGAAAQSMAVGMPRLDQVLVGLFIQAVTVAALLGATILTLRFLQLDTPVLELFVPMVYLLALMQVFAVPLILLGPNVQIIAVLVAAALMGRAGRVIAGMRTGIAVAFSLLCLMVLVLAPLALYMVFLQIPSPA
jgi:hypothetical protein